MNTQRQPTARVTVQIGYEDILTAVYNWKQGELEGLIADLQSMIQARNKARAEASEQLDSGSHPAKQSKLHFTDEELDSLRWQALAEKYHLLESPLPRTKAPLPEMMSILPADAIAPTDEEVNEILLTALLVQ